MRVRILIAATGLALAAAACSKSEDVPPIEDTVNVDAGEANLDTAALPAAGDAQAFVDTIGGSDLYEVAAGKLAEAKATDPALKAFGKMLQTDHGASSEMLKAAAAKAGATVPSAVPAEHQAHLTELEAASGAAFDTAFKTQQIAGHQKTLDALTAYAESGGQADLKAFATSAIGKVKAHLDQLKGMN